MDMIQPRYETRHNQNGREFFFLIRVLEGVVFDGRSLDEELDNDNATAADRWILAFRADEAALSRWPCSILLVFIEMLHKNLHVQRVDLSLRVRVARKDVDVWKAVVAPVQFRVAVARDFLWVCLGCGKRGRPIDGENAERYVLHLGHYETVPVG